MYTGNEELTDKQVKVMILGWHCDMLARTATKVDSISAPSPKSALPITKEELPPAVYNVATTSKWALSEKREMTEDGVLRKTYGAC